MSTRLLAAGTAALMLALAPLAQAQPAAGAQAPAAPPLAAPPPVAPPPAAPAPAAKAPAAAAAADASEGRIAYYGRKFAGRKTASGERFDPNAMTMAHKSLPFGTQVRVTNLKNKRSVVLRVNDRGPSGGDRVGDVSAGAARRLGMVRSGVADARLEVVGEGKRRGKR
ncbi:MAG: septal ring lytic transglycosylase RlpA family protein [Burkholderiaceae bacterium]